MHAARLLSMTLIVHTASSGVHISTDTHSCSLPVPLGVARLLSMSIILRSPVSGPTSQTTDTHSRGLSQRDSVREFKEDLTPIPLRDFHGHT